jgi:hypothetical protein
MKFVKFTDPSGAPCWICPTWVTKVQEPRSGEYAAGARTLIAMGATTQAVIEAPEDVVRMLEASDERASSPHR